AKALAFVGAARGEARNRVVRRSVVHFVIAENRRDRRIAVGGEWKCGEEKKRESEQRPPHAHHSVQSVCYDFGACFAATAAVESDPPPFSPVVAAGACGATVDGVTTVAPCGRSCSGTRNVHDASTRLPVFASIPHTSAR